MKYIFCRTIFDIHDVDDDDEIIYLYLREKRIQFKQCLNTFSRLLILPVRGFLINNIFASMVFIIKMVNVRNAYSKIAYQKAILRKAILSKPIIRNAYPPQLY